MATATDPPKLQRRGPKLAAKLGVALLLAAAVGTALAWGVRRLAAVAEPGKAASPRQSADVPAAPDDHLIHFAQDKWQAAGIKIAAVERRELSESEWVTGKIALNEDRLAHVYPLVEGVVREVRVQYGQQVRAGDVLAVLDSKEVGAAKLDLVKNRLAVHFARLGQEWSRTIQRNTQALIEALQDEMPVLEIEERFRDQPMGDYRQQLVTSYSHLHQTSADYDRVKQLYDQNVATARDYVKAQTDHESARATYQARLESIKFASRQQLVAAEQKMKEAETAQSVSQSLLLILGYSQREISRMDPIEEGESVAHYPIAAPLDGAIIKKDIVLLEHVTAEMQLFQIADLSSVWLRADVFEKDLPLLGELQGKPLEFRSAGYPAEKFTATVIYTGDLVDETTRAVRLIARADNPRRLLKPGMFIEVRLPKEARSGVLTAPTASVQQHAGESFVFVQGQDAEDFERRPIERGREVDGQVEILRGLEPGERIVVKGGFALKSELLRELMAED